MVILGVQTMRESFTGRLVAEFAVVVAGVLLALAADRWNQGRADTVLESAYLNRLTAEIRADSLQLDSRLRQLPRTMAARDSLLAVLDGSLAVPNLALTIAAASPAFYLRPPSTWDELEATGSLNILRDSEVREALSAYYGAQRVSRDRAFERIQNRAREPFFDELYRIGVFKPTLGDNGQVITTLSEASERYVPDVTAFRDSPEIPPEVGSIGV